MQKRHLLAVYVVGSVLDTSVYAHGEADWIERDPA